MPIIPCRGFLASGMAFYIRRNNMEEIEIWKRRLRHDIPKNKSGRPKTPRLEHLDSMLSAMKFSEDDLRVIELEINGARELFGRKKDE